MDIYWLGICALWICILLIVVAPVNVLIVVDFCSRWLSDCMMTACLCQAQKVHHVRVIGPRNSGKTSVIRCLERGGALAAQNAPQPTEGSEVTAARLNANVSFLLYETEDVRSFDLNDCKRLNYAATNASLRAPDAIVFVVDGTDVGRLPLTFKILREVVEVYYKVDTILILITKLDMLAHPHSAPVHGRGSSLPTSMGRWLTPTNKQHVALDFRQKDDALESPLLRSHERTSPDLGALESVYEQQAPNRTAHVTVQQIAKLMSHPTLFQKQWKAFNCSARTGLGIEEAFGWLAMTLTL